MEIDSGYIVLARKHRPRRFTEVAGQAVAVQTLQNALRSGRLAHAFLFSGPRGVGKTTMARLLARALNCRGGVTTEPCGECEACLEVAEGRSMDVLEIDGASNNKVEEARQLRETVRYAPARDRYRVFIIDEVHMLSTAAFNALLKTLEEPPPHIKFILATTELHKIPATILSRCQHYEFRRLSADEIRAHLRDICGREKFEAEEGALGLIARAAGGSLRDALSALDQVAARAGAGISEVQTRAVLGLIPLERVLGLFEAAAERNLPALLRIAREIFEEGSDPARFCEEVLAQARDLLVEKLTPAGEAHGDWAGVAGDDDRRRLAAAFTSEQLVRLFNLFFDLEQRLRGASLPQVLLEVACVKLVHLADLTPIEEILARLQGSGGVPRAAARGRAAAPAPSAAASASPGAAAAVPRAHAPAASGAPAGEAEGNGDERPGAARDRGPAGPDVPAQAQPAPLEGAPGDGDPDLRERFLAGVRSRKIHLASFLENAHGISGRESSILISFGPSQGFLHDKAQESLPLLQEAARELLGAGAGVTLLRQSAEAVAGAAPESEKDRRGRLLDRVIQEPIVQSAMEIFGAQIQDVQEP